MPMYFDSWSGFLAMEGHGFYVWSAYGIAMIVIAYNLIAPLLAKRRVVAEVRRQQRLVRSKVVVNDFKNITENRHKPINSPERVAGLEPVKSVERGVQ